MSDLSADPYELAKSRGLQVVLPDPDELFIDLDMPDNRVQMEEMIQVLLDNGVGVQGEKETASNGGNTHVYVRVDLSVSDGFASGTKLDPMARIALQACLGSDPKRELLSALRILLCVPRYPTVFFEKKE